MFKKLSSRTARSATTTNAGDEKKRKKFSESKCLKDKWTCEEEALWRVYMKAYAEKHDELEKKDRFKHRKAAKLATLPRVKSAEDVSAPYGCLPLNTFQMEAESDLPDKRDRSKMIRIWKNFRTDRQEDSTTVMEEPRTRTQSSEGPSLWPCDTRDLLGEIKSREMEEQRLRKDIFPCERDENLGKLARAKEEDYSPLKELGHARVPPKCPQLRKALVDRAVGGRTGLVDGDYVIFELPSKKRGLRVYAQVCIRGLKGMHLQELAASRARDRTWKFCFYQAVVALLAKTQIRYKYAWSVNIDYIYDHAWMLYTHIGALNVKNRQRFDDIIVYNYKYSVEAELVDELKDIPVIRSVDWQYEEKNMRRKVTLERKELTSIQVQLGLTKMTDNQTAPVHPQTRNIEAWFDRLPEKYQNCIFRTTKFSLAFWKDGLFWYLYNPYRCDEFGYWNDEGYACIMKFCTKASLKRHLMILLLRAYVYETPESKIPIPVIDSSEQIPEAPTPEEAEEGTEMAEEGAETAEEGAETAEEGAETAEEGAEMAEEKSQAEAQEEQTEEQQQKVEEQKSETAGTTTTTQAGVAEEVEEDKPDVFSIQIYQMVYHCCQIHNLKLLERTPKPFTHRVKKKKINDCPFDPLDWRDPCTIEQEAGDTKDEMEKPTWLKLFKMSWAKCGPGARKKVGKDMSQVTRMRWHQYHVEESNKLFSLWGELHITDGMFERENRGLQTYACYVVCAGMTRIMAPEYWSSKTLDVIVMCGDRYYTHSKLEAEFKANRPEYSHVSCWSRYLMSHFSIGETMFEANVLPAICGRLYTKSGKHLWQSLEQMFLQYQFGILTCESHCLGVFKFCGSYYMCDVNSFGPPIFQYGEGAAYLLRATYFYKFVNILILTIASPECSQFALNPIEILKVIDVGPTGPGELPIGRPERKDRRTRKSVCPYDDEKKKQMKKWKIRRAEERRTIDKTCCKHDEEG